MTRKCEFDAGSYTEKRKLATEIVNMIKQLQPPGRFLTLTKTQQTKVDTEEDALPHGAESSWVEVGLDKAVMKACQVMRDINRPDRKYRVDRKLARLNRLQALNIVLPDSDIVTGSNDSNQNVSDNGNQQECVEWEQHQQDIGIDSNKSINAIVNDVVDSIAIPIDTTGESV
jgi:hypothetical protein